MDRTRRRRAAALAAATLSVSLAACGGGGPTTSPASRADTDELAAEAAEMGEAAGGLELVPRWGWEADLHYGAGVPASDGSEIALTSGGHRVVLLDRSGDERWRAEREGVREIAPALTADLVLVGCIDGVAAFDRRTGRVRWEASFGEGASTPVVSGSTVVVTTRQGSLVGLDVGDGKVRWTVKLGGPALGPPAVDGASVVATFDGPGSAGAVSVDAASGRQRWKVALPPGGVSPPAVAAGMVVLMAGDVSARGLSAADGSPRWRAPVPGEGLPEVAPLAVADGTVAVAHGRGLAVYDAADGELVWGRYSDSDSIKGALAGPGPNGWFAATLVDGTMLLARSGTESKQYGATGRLAGVGSGPSGLLLAAAADGPHRGLVAISGW